MMAFDVDLFVIGGGSGGVRAARVAAQTGARVALAEEDRMGGTCVIRGCVPKKLMVYASGYGKMAEDAQAYGWDLSNGGFDWGQFHPRMTAELDRLEGIYNGILSNNNVTVHHQRAVVVDPHEVALADGTKISAKYILVATGGYPTRPDMPGAELAMVSNDLFHMDTLPRSMLIIGGGYIASEFAGVFNGLGVKTTQFYRGDMILRGFDQDCREHISDGMTEAGVNLRLGVNAAALAQDGDQIAVTATDGETYRFDKVLMATGRAPNSRGLGLENVGVRLQENGAVEVDNYSQTSVPSIFAIGDVTDRVQLTPVAIREAMAFVDTVFHGRPTPVDHALIPTAVFTQPEFGTIGISEAEAMERGGVEIYETRFKSMQEGFAGRAEKVLMKLIVDAKDRTVLGCHIVAPHAGEMIQLAGIAVKMGATKEQFDQTCAVHPTMAEELVTMREPARKG